MQAMLQVAPTIELEEVHGYARAFFSFVADYGREYAVRKDADAHPEVRTERSHASDAVWLRHTCSAAAAHPCSQPARAADVSTACAYCRFTHAPQLLLTLAHGQNALPMSARPLVRIATCAQAPHTCEPP
jgi:hypothetical protein